MKAPARFLLYWAPVLLWMAVIFSASSDAGSSQRTSRFIRPLVLWVHPGLPEETVDRVVYAVRKGAHVTEYAVLAALLWRALRGPRPSPGWSWRVAGLALTLAVAYAVTDELHQLFVPTREGRFRDVLYDAAGAALALALIGFWQRWRMRRLSRQPPTA